MGSPSSYGIKNLKTPFAKATVITVDIKIEIKAMRYLFSDFGKRKRITSANKTGPAVELTKTQATIFP